MEKSFNNFLFNLEYVLSIQSQFIPFASGLSGSDSLFSWVIPSLSSNSEQIKIRAVMSNTNTVLDELREFTLRPSPAIDLGNDTFYCDGSSISLVLDAGSGYSSYLWSDSSSNQTLSVNTEGVYEVTVTNSFTREASDEIEVFKALRPVISSKMITDISCYGNTDGSISIVTVSGTQPYQFLWNTNDTTEDLNNLSAGNLHFTSHRCKRLSDH
ncbi:MAG: SprB repeat-containing protein [Bacteroidia bacterium]